jgi:lysophospholipase L1-like esterase
MTRDWWTSEFRLLVTLGESITAGGWSSSPERCWASRLATMVSDVQSRPVELFNAGIGANVISTHSPCYEWSGKPAATERLEKHVIDRAPDLLVVSYGINDARGGTPRELFGGELEGIIDRVRERIAPLIILLGPYYSARFDIGGERWSHASREVYRSFNDLTRSIARVKDCLFVDVLAALGEADWLVHFDGVHLNDVGHMVVATEVFKVLARNCSGIALRTRDKENLIPAWRDESTLAADYGYERGGIQPPRKEPHD